MSKNEKVYKRFLISDRKFGGYEVLLNNHVLRWKIYDAQKPTALNSRGDYQRIKLIYNRFVFKKKFLMKIFDSGFMLDER